MVQKGELMPGGRPTSYKPEYNQFAIEHFKKGKTVVQLAAHFEVARTTIYQWAEDNPEFYDTLRKGAALAQSYWENVSHAKSLGSKETKDASERGIEFILKTRFRDDYSEKAHVDVTSNGNSISINIDKEDSEL